MADSPLDQTDADGGAVSRRAFFLCGVGVTRRDDDDDFDDDACAALDRDDDSDSAGGGQCRPWCRGTDDEGGEGRIRVGPRNPAAGSVPGGGRGGSVRCQGGGPPAPAAVPTQGELSLPSIP